MPKPNLFYQQKCVAMILCLIVLFSGLLFSGQSLAATFYLIRHAEKQLGDNPPLTQQGEQRAQRIAGMLATADIDLIYSTNYHRTQATAQPLADSKHLPVVTYDAGDLENFAAQLLKENRNAVIIGHSNTTPQLVRLLSAHPVPDMDEQTYHLIYQVVMCPDATKSRAVVNILSSD